GARDARNDVAGRLSVHLHAIDAARAHALDGERLRAAHAHQDAGLAAARVVARVEGAQALVARLADYGRLRLIRMEAERHPRVRLEHRHGDEGLLHHVYQLLGAVPDAAERVPLLDDHSGNTPGGGIGHRHLAATVPHLEDERLVVGHA